MIFIFYHLHSKQHRRVPTSELYLLRCVKRSICVKLLLWGWERDTAARGIFLFTFIRTFISMLAICYDYQRRRKHQRRDCHTYSSSSIYIFIYYKYIFPPSFLWTYFYYYCCDVSPLYWIASGNRNRERVIALAPFWIWLSWYSVASGRARDTFAIRPSTQIEKWRIQRPFDTVFHSLQIQTEDDDVDVLCVIQKRTEQSWSKRRDNKASRMKKSNN